MSHSRHAFALAVATAAGSAIGASSPHALNSAQLAFDARTGSSAVKVGGEVYAGPNGDLVLIPTGAVRSHVGPRSTLSPLWLSAGTLCDDGVTPFAPLSALNAATDTDGDGTLDEFLNTSASSWGDLPFDTVVTGMRIGVATSEPTPDTDGDGIPESIAQTTVVVTFYDNDDGFNSREVGGTEVAAFELPMFGDPTPTDAYITAFFYTWDFATDFVDASGNPIDASFTIANTSQATDLDGDGRGDFGYEYSFNFADGDGDGELELFETFVQTGAPEPNPIPPQGTGGGEGIDLYLTSLDGAAPSYLGTVTGFTGSPCSTNPSRASLGIELFSDGSSCCAADINCDGVFNTTDINLFISGFLTQIDIGDLNGDQLFNNVDINLFVQLFLSQCS